MDGKGGALAHPATETDRADSGLTIYAYSLCTKILVKRGEVGKYPFHQLSPVFVTRLLRVTCRMFVEDVPAAVIIKTLKKRLVADTLLSL